MCLFLFQVSGQLLQILSLEAAGGAAGFADGFDGGQRVLSLDLLDQIETPVQYILLALDDQRDRSLRASPAAGGVMDRLESK